VSGRGGNDQSGDEGSVSNRLVGTQVVPASAERHTSLGSVPTHTTSRSTGLATMAMISRPARPADRQDRPPSSLLNTPSRCVPHHARPCTSASDATQVGRSVIPCADAAVPRSTSMTTTSRSVATSIGMIATFRMIVAR
jgi:hypothetical protein